MKGIILLTVIGFALAAPSGRQSRPCVCELVVDGVRALVATHDTQEQVLEYVSDTCSHLEGEEDKDTCRTLIQKYSDIIFDTVTSHLTPQQVCKQIPNACPVEAEAPPAVLEAPPVQEELEPRGIVECELCKLIIVAVDKIIETNKSEAAINETLEKFCNSLPASLSGTCKEIEPKILDAIKNGIEPETACKAVDFCTDGENIYVPCDACLSAVDAIGIHNPNSICMEMGSCTEEVFIEEPEPETNAVVEPVEEREPAETKEELKGAFECQLCKLLVNAIDKLVGENKTAATVNATLIEFCEALPNELKDDCLSIEPEILKAILGGIDPTMACDFVKACQGSTSQFEPCDVCKEMLEGVAGEGGLKICYEIDGICEEELKNKQAIQVPKLGADPECDLCKFFVQTLDDILEDNATIIQVNATLFAICQAVAKQYQKQCMQLIPRIETIMEHGFDPTNSCIAVGMCESEGTAIQKEDKALKINISVPPLAKLGDDVTCELCKFFIETLDDIVEDNATIPEVNTTLYTICKAIKVKEYQLLCTQLIPKIETILEHGFDPTNSCIAVGMCESESTTVQKEDKKMDINISIPPIAELEDDAKCELCQYVVTLLDQALEDNATIAQVNATLFSICKAIPKDFQMLCTTLIPRVETILELGFDAKNACIAVKMCDMKGTPLQKEQKSRDINRSAPPEVEIKMVAQPRGRRSIEDNMERWQSMASTIQQVITDEDHMDASFLGCELCKIVVRLVDEIAGQNASIDTVNKTLKEICERLSGDQLIQICLQETPKLLKFMSEGIQPDQVCKAASLCDQVSKAEDVPQSLTEILENKGILGEKKPDNVGDLKCDICEELVKLLDGVITKNSSEQEINETLHRLCEGLPAGAFQDICLSFIPDIMKVIEEGGLDPDTACTLAKLCASETETVIVEENLKEPTKKEDRVGDLKCDLCQELLKIVDAELADNETDAKINETLYRICQGLPQGPIQDECIVVVADIMKVVESGGFDPEKTCETARLCLSGMKGKRKTGLLSHYLHEDRKKKIQNVRDLKCEICEAVIDEVDALIQENTTKAEINETIYGFCNDLIGALQDICLQLAPQVVNAIEAGADYKIICSKIGLCPEQEHVKATKPVQKRTEKVGDLKCELCETLVDEVDNILGQNATIAKINETVYNLCNRLPGAIKDDCLQIAPQVVATIAKGGDPKTVCTEVRLCASQQEVMAPEPIQKTKEKVGDLKCELCEFLVDSVDNILGKNATIAKINETVYDLCNRLPGEAKDSCLQIAPQVVATIAKGGDPKMVCTAVRLCVSQQEEVRPLVVEMAKPLLCEACIRTIGIVYNNIENDYPKIQPALASLCQHLPEQLQEKCQVSIKDDQGMYLKGFLELVNPELLCDSMQCQ